MISWNVAQRDPETCRDSIEDFAARLANRIPLTRHGLGLYKGAVRLAFGKDDDGMLVESDGPAISLAPCSITTAART